MWSALRSDLKEFVSTVTVDTSKVLSKLDDNLDEREENDEDESKQKVMVSPEEKEANRRRMLEETYTAPLIHPDDEQQEEDSGEGGDDEDKKARVRLREYIASFTLDEQEKEKHLEKYGEDQNGLRFMYERLVPDQVSDTDFWMRYMYRCDADRIGQEWAEQEEAMEVSRSKIASTLGLGVKSFLGGAAMAVSQLTHDTTRSDTATKFLDTKGRPPFVMNTAMDEDDDDDDDDAGEEEDEEEELGWDDDDEDEEDEDDDGGDEDDDGEDDDDNKSEHIEFEDKATEQLQEQYRQAIEERDMLHQTVEMQGKQIADLTQKLEQQGGDSATGPAVVDGTNVNNKDEVERLKMQLFESAAELAAVKARLSDDASSPRASKKTAATDEEKLNNRIAALEQEKAQAFEALAAKESQLSALKSSMESLQSELQNVSSSLDATKQYSQGEIISLQNENQSLREQVQRLEESRKQEVESLKDELKLAQSRFTSSEQRISSLEAELEAARALLVEKEATLNSNTDAVNSNVEVSSHDTTVSSGVKVESPSRITTPTATKLETNEDDSDWGDDW